MTLEIAESYTKEGKNEGNIFICLQSKAREL